MKVVTNKDIIRVLVKQGGLLKRIDEHRELICLLKINCNEFLEGKQWVKNWLKAQDEFLCSLKDLLDDRTLDQISRVKKEFLRNLPDLDSSIKNERD